MTTWLPLGAKLLRPLPLTTTEVAFALDHEIIVEPGALAPVGDAVIDALTDEAAATVNLAVWVAGPFGPWAVIV